MARAEALGLGASNPDPVFIAWLCNAKAFFELTRGAVGPGLDWLSEARVVAERSGAGLARVMTWLYYVSALVQTGHLERATAAAKELESFCEPLGLLTPLDWNCFFLSMGQIAVGEAQAAIAPLRGLLGRDDQYLVANTRSALALALHACGDEERALQEASAAQQHAAFPWHETTALRSLSLLELDAGRPARALVQAERGITVAESGSFALNTSRLLLTRAEALRALDRSVEAREAICHARDSLLQVAAGIRDQELRTSFLARVRVHARTLQLANDWVAKDA